MAAGKKPKRETVRRATERFEKKSLAILRRIASVDAERYGHVLCSVWSHSKFSGCESNFCTRCGRSVVIDPLADLDRSVRGKAIEEPCPDGDPDPEWAVPEEAESSPEEDER